MKKKISVEGALIKGLKDARDFEKGHKKLKTHERILPSPAPIFKSRDIKDIRLKILGLTQEEFAQVLNVAIITVRSWEQGIRRPEKASNRLLQILKEHPQIISELKGA
jgi:DNA-binding transcriptional regulator YiaG